jgi:hemoglobin-like flavoprotein
MNTRQITLVQQTFALAAPVADEVADSFYQRLFEIDPSLRTLFAGDLKSQGEKLMTVLAFVVQGLNQPDTLVEPVRRLGRRHAQYGVQSHHYALVGDALLWTLAQKLGAAFTHDVYEAWHAAYSLLAELMQEAAAQAEIAA